MGRGFDPQRIAARLHVLPFIQAGQLVLARHHLNPQTQAVVDYGHRHLTRRVGCRLVLPDLFGKAIGRGGHGLIAGALIAVTGGMGGPDHIGNRRQIAAARSQKRRPNVDVIEKHMRRRQKPGVDHPVTQADFTAAKVNLDPAVQGQLRAKGGGLPHLAGRPQDATIPLPPLAVSSQLGGDGRDAAMQPVGNGLDPRIVVSVGRNLLGAQDVIQTAGHQKARKTAPPAEPTLAVMLVQTGVPHTGWAVPAD